MRYIILNPLKYYLNKYYLLLVTGTFKLDKEITFRSIFIHNECVLFLG